MNNDKKRIHENYLTPLIKQNILHSNCHEQRNLPYVSIYIYIFIYICMYIYNSFKYIYIYIEAPRSLAPAEGIMGPSAPLGFGAFGPKTLKIFQSSSKFKNIFILYLPIFHPNFMSLGLLFSARSTKNAAILDGVWLIDT